MAIRVEGIEADFTLNDKEFVSKMKASKEEMAEALLRMQKLGSVKIDPQQWRELQGQLKAIQGRADEVRGKLLKATPGSEEAKKLKTELQGVNERLRLLKQQAEPTRKELERLARANRDVANAGGGRGGQMKDAAISVLPGQAGAIAGAAGSNPYAAAALALAAIATSGAAASAALVKNAMNLGEYAEGMLNLAEKTGLSTTRLQELKYVSDIAGVSFESVTNAVSQIQRKLMGMEEDSGPAAEAMKRLGISIFDASGNLKSMDTLFPQILSKLQDMQDVTTRNMLAAQIFGKGFGDLAPILGMTSAELDRAAKRAQQLGLVLTPENLAKASDFDDALGDVQAAFAGLLMEIGTDIMPELLELLTQFKDEWPKNKAELLKFWAQVKPVFTFIVDGLKGIVENGEKVRAVLTAMLPPGLLLLLDKLTGKGIIHIEKPKVATEEKDEPDPKASEAAMLAMQAQAELAARAAQSIAAMRRELYLNGDATAEAAMQWEILNGQFAKADEATKANLLSLAKETDAQRSARDAAKAHADEQKRLAQEAAKAADEMAGHQVQKLNEMVENIRSSARSMVDAMKSFADETVQAVADGLRREQDARDAAADEARAKYNKLKEIGKAGAMAMTNITMFGDKKTERKPLTAADFTPDRMAAAAAEVIANRGREAEINAKMQAGLFGSSIGQANRLANTQGPDMFGASVQQQVGYLSRMVELMQRQLDTLTRIERPAIRRSY